MAAALEEQVENIRSKLASLKVRRDDLDRKLLNLHSQLRKHNVTMTEPLVDGEGYPRSDIDVYTIRHIRHEIICKQNDCKALTEEMRMSLYELHSQEKKKVDSIDSTLKPFALVQEVDKNSPAHKAGLKVGDLILKIGNFSARNFKEFQPLQNFINTNLGNSISVHVLRGGALCSLSLIPGKWNGPGHLGCRLLRDKNLGAFLVHTAISGRKE